MSGGPSGGRMARRGAARMGGGGTTHLSHERLEVVDGSDAAEVALLRGGRVGLAEEVGRLEVPADLAPVVALWTEKGWVSVWRGRPRSGEVKHAPR